MRCPFWTVADRADAGYYLAVASNGKSMIAGGKVRQDCVASLTTQWGADKNDLATIRTNINRNSKPLRKLISAPEFEKLFGKAKSGNGRSNIFGRDECVAASLPS